MFFTKKVRAKCIISSHSETPSAFSEKTGSAFGAPVFFSHPRPSFIGWPYRESFLTGTVYFFWVKFGVLRTQCLCGHESLSIIFRFAQILRKCSRPRLGHFSAEKWYLRLHKSPAGKAVCLLFAICDPTENRTLILSLRRIRPSR